MYAAAPQRLAELLSLDVQDIHSALVRIERGDAYRTFEIAKRGSRPPRSISSPVEPLKHVQRRLNRMLAPFVIGRAVHGFQRGRSIVTAARMHVRARSMASVDLADFFHAVDDRTVLRVLSRALLPHWAGVSLVEARAVLQLITKLTTLQIPKHPRPVLPQGAPTSPTLANLAARSLDARIGAALDDMSGEYVYTRYADDLTISSPGEIDGTLLDEVTACIRRSGFSVNDSKVSLASTIKGSLNYRQKLEVTGLVIDARAQCVRIPRARMAEFRNELRKAADLPDPDERVENRVQGIVSYVQMIYGCLPPPMEDAYARFRR